MIKAVVFDFDGVIVDSLNAGFFVTNKILEMFGKPGVVMEEFREEFGADWKKFYRDRDIPEELIEKEPVIFKREMDLLKKELTIFTGIDTVIHELMKNYRLGIVSNNHREFIIEFLKKFGIHDHFGSVVGYLPGAIKPDIKPLLICLKELGVRPEETCVIGDTNDEIVMARKANVAKVIAVSYGFHPLHKLEGADIIVHSPEEIIAAIAGGGE
ncbi:MAG: HAD family hydrolase [Candidatus Aenigmarchaeota archaeon]|nr:HAD family hydrolase [Candidatus Aenigmarchaeota archaeon]